MRAESPPAVRAVILGKYIYIYTSSGVARNPPVSESFAGLAPGVHVGREFAAKKLGAAYTSVGPHTKIPQTKIISESEYLGIPPP